MLVHILYVILPLNVCNTVKLAHIHLPYCHCSRTRWLHLYLPLLIILQVAVSLVVTINHNRQLVPNSILKHTAISASYRTKGHRSVYTKYPRCIRGALIKLHVGRNTFAKKFEITPYICSK